MALPVTGAEVSRYRLLVAYDGTAYHGFQLQRPSLDTVAGRLERALAGVSPEGARGERIAVEGASRTDAGVHARGQVCAFSSRLTVPVERLPMALNGLLPPDIVVWRAEPARPGFEPRREARTKTYCYRIWRASPPSPFWRNWAWHVPQQLDLAACRAALEPLPGRHDFAAFRDTGSTAVTTVRTILEARLESQPFPAAAPCPGEFVSVWLTGDGFLYRMVRIIVGTLIEVGLGRFPPEATRRALASGRREDLGPTAPAGGLCLERVGYEPEESRPRRSEPSPESRTAEELEGFRFP